MVDFINEFVDFFVRKRRSVGSTPLQGSKAADDSPAKRRKASPAAQAPKGPPPAVAGVNERQQQQGSGSFQRVLQEVQQDAAPTTVQFFSRNLFQAAGTAAAPPSGAADKRKGSIFGEVNPALPQQQQHPQMKQFVRRRQQQPHSTFSPGTAQGSRWRQAPWLLPAQQQQPAAWQGSAGGRGASRAATLGLQAAAATPDTTRQRLDFAGGAAADSPAPAAAGGAGGAPTARGHRAVAAVRSRLQQRSTTLPAAAGAAVSPQTAVHAAMFAGPGGNLVPSSNLVLGSHPAGHQQHQQQQPLPAWFASPAATFVAQLVQTADVIGTSVQQAAAPSPLAGGFAVAGAAAAAAAANPEARILQDLAAAQAKFNSQLGREQLLMRELDDTVVRPNQAALRFDLDYQINAASQTAIAIQRHAADLQQRRHEAQQKLLLAAQQQRVNHARSSLQQQPHWLQQPQQQPAAVSAAPPPKQQQQQDEEEDDDVVLISDSDDEEPQQQQLQQPQDELFGELAHEGQQQPGWAEDGSYGGSEPESEQEQEQEESEVSGEEESEGPADEAAAGIAGLELSWMGRPVSWEPTQQQRARFETALHSGPMTGVVVTHERANIDLTRELLQCMLPGQWLNDEVMNFYVALLQDRDTALRGRPGVPSCHFFNTFFINKLYRDARAYNYNNVRKWTLPKRLVSAGQVSDCVLKCDRVIVPVHEGAHWTAAMVDVAGRRLLYFDSLRGRNTALMAALRRWVQDEAKDKLAADWDVSSWPELYPDAIPAQNNSFDCGVFALLFANRLGLGRGFDFRQPDLTHNARVLVGPLVLVGLACLLCCGVLHMPNDCCCCCWYCCCCQVTCELLDMKLRLPHR